MSVDIIVGAHYGDEGKSKFARYYSDAFVEYDGAIKIGGYSKSTFYDRKLDRMVTCNMLPAATNGKNNMLYLFPGFSYVNLAMLKKEAIERGISFDQILIDTDAHVENENGEVLFASVYTDTELEGMQQVNVSKYLSESGDKRFLVEGQHGFGIAKKMTGYNWNGDSVFIPEFIAPTTVASGIVSLLNISPSEVNDIILVSRIGSVPKVHKDVCDPDMNPWKLLLYGEEQYPLMGIDPIEDFPYDIEMVSDAILVNSPSLMVLNFLDVVDSSAKDTEEYSEKQLDIIDYIEDQLGTTFDFVGNGKRNVAPLIYSEEKMAELEDETLKQLGAAKQLQRMVPSSRVLQEDDKWDGKYLVEESERYYCLCGKMKGIENRGKVCNLCHTIVVDNDPEKMEDKNETTDEG